MSWVQVGKGRLSIRGRPGKKFWEALTLNGVTRLVTLLSAREGAETIGEEAQRSGITWTWIPLENASEAVLLASSSVRAQLPLLADALTHGESIVIHCSAGIHRTGMVAYALLRLSGYSPEEARHLLGEMRMETGNGVGEERLHWAEHLIQDLMHSAEQ